MEKFFFHINIILAKWFDHLKHVLEKNQLFNRPDAIWNVDESGFTDDPGRKQVIVKRSTKYPTSSHSGTGKTHTTVLMSSNQLNGPGYIFVDRQQAVYVSDHNNHRVMKWNKGATESIVVAGGQGEGSALTHLHHPEGLVIDTLDTLYVSDSRNHRVMRWPKGATQGTAIVGGNGEGEGANQFNRLIGLSFDRHGNLYIVDDHNHRVQRFSIQ
ncbi:unnamed protein product [Rotaria socialis]